MAPNTALKTALFTSGITQTTVARKTGIHESRLSRIIRGHSEPSDDEKRQIAKALRKPVDGLFAESVTSQS